MKKEAKTGGLIMRLAGAAALAFAVTSAANAKDLSAAGIKKAISGKKVYLSTPYGLELPLKYAANGHVTGNASGFSVAGLITPKETGKWWVKGSSMCQKWPTWYDGKTFCFTLEKTGADMLSWRRDDGLKGTARIGK